MKHTKLGHRASTGDRLMWEPEGQQQSRDGGSAGRRGWEGSTKGVKIRIHPGHPLVVDGSSKHCYEDWHFRPGMVRETQENDNI